jgi:hypothetical protein
VSSGHLGSDRSTWADDIHTCPKVVRTKGLGMGGLGTANEIARFACDGRPTQTLHVTECGDGCEGRPQKLWESARRLAAPLVNHLDCLEAGSSVWLRLLVKGEVAPAPPTEVHARRDGVIERSTSDTEPGRETRAELLGERTFVSSDRRLFIGLAESVDLKARPVMVDARA